MLLPKVVFYVVTFYEYIHNRCVADNFYFHYILQTSFVKYCTYYLILHCVGYYQTYYIDIN